jgi:hypothetical protein
MLSVPRSYNQERKSNEFRSVWFRETIIITVLKSVAKKRLVKTKEFDVSCDFSDNLSVWFSETYNYC